MGAWTRATVRRTGVPRREVNAHVGAHFAAFDATGSPTPVVDFLARVCGQFARLTRPGSRSSARCSSPRPTTRGGRWARPSVHRLPPSSHPSPTGRELRPRMFSGVPRGARDGSHVLRTGDGPAGPLVVGDFKGMQEAVTQARLRLPEWLFVDDPGEPTRQAS